MKKIGLKLAVLALTCASVTAMAKCKNEVADPSGDISWMAYKTAVEYDRAKISMGRTLGNHSGSYNSSQEQYEKYQSDIGPQIKKTRTCLSKAKNKKALDALADYSSYLNATAKMMMTQGGLTDRGFSAWLSNREETLVDKYYKLDGAME